MRPDPDRLGFRRGLPAVVQAVLWGLAVILLAGGVSLLVSARTRPAGGLVVAGIGIACLLLALGRSGVLIDRGRGLVISWWGLAVPWQWDLPLRRRPVAADRLRVVLLTEETWYRSENGDGTRVLVIYLLSNHELLGAAEAAGAAGQDPGGHERVFVSATLRYVTSRRRAEQVARFLDIGIVDETTYSRKTYRSPGTLDEPYTWRAGWTEELVETPTRPATARSSYQVVGDEGVLEIANRRRSVAAAATALGAVLLAVTGALIGWVPWALVAGLGWLPLILVLWLVVVPASVHDQVTVSPRGITVRRRSLLGRRILSIPAVELEELDLRWQLQRSLATISYSGTVVAGYSDRQVIELAPGLAEEEQRWLLGVLRCHLLGLA